MDVVLESWSLESSKGALLRPREVSGGGGEGLVKLALANARSS